MIRTDEPAVEDVTASMRRKARREAMRILLAAGWDVRQMALAFGISVAAVMRLMPREGGP